ncbi:hypothetical protein L209DRAFT_753480 [Thermothelomyces heterothallicus CBS 203.75]
MRVSVLPCGLALPPTLLTNGAHGSHVCNPYLCTYHPQLRDGCAFLALGLAFSFGWGVGRSRGMSAMSLWFATPSQIEHWAKRGFVALAGSRRIRRQSSFHRRRGNSMW